MDYADLDREYENMSKAYSKIYSRCGLDFRIVTADSGMMGGTGSQEFMVICPYGEDRIAFSKKDYLASVEVAKRANPNLKALASQSSTYEVFDTPNLRTIEELSHRYKLKPAQMVKTLIYMVDGKPVSLKYIGYEQVEEAIESYYQVTNIPTVKNITVQNNLLFEYSPQQISIIHITVNGNRKSTKLNQPDDQAKFGF